jgi:RNA polymerase-interacting CarD/CdnL/TRCF family regulator
MKSEFMEWFVAQHKARTDSGMPSHTDQQLHDMVQTGRVADRVLACRELWDDKKQSALYAHGRRVRRRPTTLVSRTARRVRHNRKNAR